ncbi:NUDIX hydrolase [Nocardia anaemiae]|uniref:NUDIX hydrolase n=1 Tax=Nocardia anaemiae TaxID=263910 RepID=UPI0012F49C6D|nr:NUDIX domain-containing protein [Nocardia anaemiae]
MLVRDGATGPEVFLQRRVGAMAFAAGMTVFPGGGVDPSDGTADIEWAGPEPAWWAAKFGTTEPRAKALVAAAVRETFEECGVLLAGPTGETVVSDTTGYHDARGRLERREVSLAAFLAEEKLVLRADLLRPWANWITPVIEPRRYDTRFFVAVLPQGQLADGATSEAAEVQWRTAAEALERWRAGTDVLLPPTWSQLDAMAEFASTAEILAVDRVIEPIMPVLTGDSGRQVLEFPDNHRYFAGMPDTSRLRGSARP